MLSTTYEFLLGFLNQHRPWEGKVLDVGCLDVNGSLRNQFDGFEYLGIDMREGKNVDKVLNAHDIKKEFKEGSFDIVVCFDTLEHDDKFWISVENMKWVLKRGGWLLIGAPSFHHPRHDHPFDFWRFTRESFKQVIFEGMDNVFVVEQCYFGQNDDMPDQVFGWGQKK